MVEFFSMWERRIENLEFLKNIKKFNKTIYIIFNVVSNLATKTKEQTEAANKEAAAATSKPADDKPGFVLIF